ncbi:MAG: hypothetical protein KDI03_09730 [Anaerolineae bacterium]|nr:hypothetical protein [Anaerolineae bacterium]
MLSVMTLALVLTLIIVPAVSAQSGGIPRQPGMPASGIAPTAPVVQIPAQTSSNAPVATISVDDDYTSITPGWGTTAFDTIQGGINQATSGDTVLVYPGNYAESPTVDKPLTLQAFAGNRYYPAPIALSATQAPGYWYPDRYPPYAFADDNSTFTGKDVIKHSINIADSAANRPSGYSSTFYNTQGRKYDTSLTGSVQSMSIDMWVDSTWVGNDRYAGLWSTGIDGANAISAYPIIAFRNSAVTPGFYTWDYTGAGAWVLVQAATPGDYDQWHNLSFVLTVGTGVEYFLDGVSMGTLADVDTVSLENVILNAYNYGANYDVYWDNFLVGSDGPAAFESAITGKLTIDASNDTVDGFYMTNPGQTNAVLIKENSPSHSDILLTHNYVTNVGSNALTSNVHAILVNKGPDNVTIQENRLDNLKSGTKSVSAIGVLDTASTDESSNLLIEDTVIADVVSSSWGSYGIIINNVAGAPDAQILNNSISDLEGLWAHGIGLEGPTPNALVQGNKLNNLIDHKSPTDAAAVQVEANPDAGTVDIYQNCFTNVNIGVQNVTGIEVDAVENWWGNGSGPYNATTNPGGTGAAATDDVAFSPWVTEGCGGATTILSASTTDPIICAGETTVVNIDLTDVVGLYGYQIEVNYNDSMASASGAFVNSFFDTLNNANIAGGWDADCTTTPGTCRFSVAKEHPATAVTGSGVLAQITLTGVSTGDFDITVGTNILTDIDGVQIYHNVFTPLPITVCGQATISGFVTMQGRPGNNVDLGTVTMTEQGGPNFSPVAPVDFDATSGAYSISVPYLPTGGTSYKILAEHDLYLDNEDTILVAGNLANKNTRLWGGDANNDGDVTIADLSCIGGSFGAPPAGSCAGGSSDINADGLINVQDLAIAGGNFDKCGAQPWAWNVATPNFCP